MLFLPFILWRKGLSKWTGSGIDSLALIKRCNKSQVEGNKTISPARNMAPFFQFVTPGKSQETSLIPTYKDFLVWFGLYWF